MSWQAFSRSLQIALAYPLLLFIASWVAGGSGEIAGIALLPELSTWWLRSGVAALLVGFSLIFAWCFKHLDKIQNWIETNLFKFLKIGSVETRPFITLVIEALALVLALAPVLVLVLGLGLVFVFVLALVVGLGPGLGLSPFLGLFLALFLVFGLALVLVLGLVNALGFGLALVFGLVLGLDQLSSPGVSSFIVFFMILPLVNSGFDFFSWVATRFFLRKIVKRPAGFKSRLLLAFDILADIAIALACLIGLAVVLPNAVLALNIGLSWFGASTIEWPTYVYAAIHNPLGGGLLVWGMLLSTILPTLIHLTVGFKALFDSLTPNDTLRGLFPTQGQGWEDTGARNRVKIRLLYRRIWWLPAGILSGGGIAAICYALYAFFEQFAWTLGAVAFSATYWSTGYWPFP